MLAQSHEVAQGGGRRGDGEGSGKRGREGAPDAGQQVVDGVLLALGPGPMWPPCLRQRVVQRLSGAERELSCTIAILFPFQYLANVEQMCVYLLACISRGVEVASARRTPRPPLYPFLRHSPCANSLFDPRAHVTSTRHIS